MIYQPRNVQPSGVSIDGLLDNTFTMEIQTNSYVSAYQLLIVDFDNNEIYTGAKTTLAKYAYNGDTLEIPVSASAVALSNGTNYKWRVRLYQPTADMLITYGLVQATSTTTTIYLQPNINIKAGMAITINSQTKTISSYNSDTGVAVVSSAFSSAPAVGTQYKIYSDFIETVPDYIVYARRTPAVAISNVPSSLTLKYHTFQGTYIQSDNVPIVYHKFDLYTKNDDGTISLVASSDKVYSANLSYTYDSFRTGNKYLIQMTVENDMGVITTTDMYEFNVSYDIVEYLQQPLASFDDKNNAVKVSWVTPVEHDATSFRSDAATGIIQDNNNTLTQATFEPGQSIGEGDVVQITNSDCELVIDGKSTQKTTTGKNLLPYPYAMSTATINGVTVTDNGNGCLTINGTSTGTVNFLLLPTNGFFENGTYIISLENGNSGCYLFRGAEQSGITGKGVLNEIITVTNNTFGYFILQMPSGKSFNNLVVKPMIRLASITDDTYEPYTGGQPSPSPDYPSEIESVGGKNLFDVNSITENTYLISGSGETGGSSVSNVSDYIFVKANQSYYLSYSYTSLLSTAYRSLCYYDTNKNFISGIAIDPASFHTFTPVQDGYVRFSYDKNYTNIQLEKDTVATDYVPYDTIQVKSVGKNLLNLPDGTYTNNGLTAVISNGIININGTSTSTSFLNIPINLELESDFSISLNNTAMGDSLSVVRLQISGSIYQSVPINVVNNKKVNISSYGTYTSLLIRVSSGVTITNGIIKPQVELGYTTDYEPYQSNTSSIDLQGNELYSLPRETKDEINITNGGVLLTKRINKVILNGSENWELYSNKIHTFVLRMGQTIDKHDVAYCSHFTEINPDKFDVKTGIYSKYTDFIIISYLDCDTVDEFKTWLSTHNVELLYELEKPYTVDLGNSVVPYIDGINYMHILSNINTTFSLVYPHKTISGNAYDYTEFNPPGAKQTGTIKSYNAITGVGTLMPQYPFMYTPMQGDSYAVISNIYNVSGFSYLYNTPYNTVNSLYTHSYTATWATPDGLCVLPDDFNITLQFSPDGNFFYDQDGVYQEVVDLITTETDGINNEGEFTIKIDKNKLIFVQNPDISLELPFYTNTTQVFVLSSANIAQINNDYIWDDTATWTDTYTWVEGGTSLERVCNHWWKVQITNTGIKIEEIFPTT